MTNERQPSKPRSKWHVGLLVVATVFVGLFLGVTLGFLAENKPFEERSTARLVRDLRKTDSPLDRLRQKLWPALPNVIADGLSHFTPMSADVVRQLAAVELRRRAPSGSEAVPALVRALRDPHNGVCGMALQALAGFGPAASFAVPQVLPMLDMSGNPVLRSEAARTLIAIAPNEPQVRARLLAILRDRPASAGSLAGKPRRLNASEEALRSAVIRIMDKLPNPNDDVVPLLLSELAQSDGETTVEVIGALQRIGPITPAIIPTLVLKFKEAQREATDLRPSGPRPQQRDDVVAAVLRALQRLARTDNDAVPLLIATLPEADPFMTARIMQTLGLIGPLTAQVIPTVLKYLEASHPRIQLSAVGALGTMGSKAASAVPNLVRLLEAQRPSLTNEPAQAGIDERDLKSDVVVAEFDSLYRAAVEPAWDDPMPPRMRVRPGRPLREAEIMALQIMRSLARIGAAAWEGVSTLVKLMSEIRSELRYEAALTVWQIERTNDAAKTVLIEGLNIPTPEFPRRLIRHFRNMGVGELPILNAALDHIDEEVRIAAFNVVSALALQSEPAVATLERVADDSINPLRVRAARALESIRLRAAQGSNAAKISDLPLREPAN